MYRNEEMFSSEETVSHDLTVDDASSTLRVTWAGSAKLGTGARSARGDGVPSRLRG